MSSIPGLGTKMPTCPGATNPMSHNYQSPNALEPMLTTREAPIHHNWEKPVHSLNKLKKKIKKRNKTFLGCWRSVELPREEVGDSILAGSQDETSFREPKQKQASLCLFILRIESEEGLVQKDGWLGSPRSYRK